MQIRRAQSERYSNKPPQFSVENNRYYCQAKIITINGVKSASDIKLSFKENPELRADNEILLSGYVYKTGASVKSIENHFKSDRIYIGCYSIKNLKVTDSDFKGYYYFSEKVKNYICTAFLDKLDARSSGLMISFLTGDKTYLDNEISNNFNRSGVSHLMAVSGIHLSVWITLLGFIAEKFNCKRKVFPYAIMIFTVIFVMITASFSGSVKRAGFMCILYLFSKILSQNSDSLNNLGFSVTTVLIINPYSVFDIGFLLSFLSTIAIIVFAIPQSETIIKRVQKLAIHRLFKAVLSPVIQSVMISTFIFILTLPVISATFGYISTMSVVSNLLLLPVSFALILVAGFLVITNPVNLISTPLAFVASLLSRYAIYITDLLSDFRYAVLPVKNNITIPWLIIFGALSYLCLYKRKTQTLSKILTVSAIVICVTLSVVSFRQSICSYKLYIIPADNKISVLLSMNSKGVLIGYNDSYYFEENVLNLAKKNNIDIDCMISTKSRKSSDFAKINNIDNIITQTGMNINIMNTVSISTEENKIVIEGNDSKFEIYNESHLQYADEYDIISIGCDNQTNGLNNLAVDADSDLYIQSLPKGKIRTGGDFNG